MFVTCEISPEGLGNHVNVILRSPETVNGRRGRSFRYFDEPTIL